MWHRVGVVKAIFRSIGGPHDLTLCEYIEQHWAGKLLLDCWKTMAVQLSVCLAVSALLCVVHGKPMRLGLDPEVNYSAVSVHTNLMLTPLVIVIFSLSLSLSLSIRSSWLLPKGTLLKPTGSLLLMDTSLACTEYLALDPIKVHRVKLHFALIFNIQRLGIG